MAQRAALPKTGSPVTGYADGVAKNKHGADLNLSVAQAKAAVAKQRPDRDVSTENLGKAKGWTDGSVPGQHTPRQ
jgi:hypothetical protein